MSQLNFPRDNVLVQPASSTAKPVPTATNDNVAARKCRAAADALDKHIEAKHDGANRMFALPPTRKRLQEVVPSTGIATGEQIAKYGNLD